MSNNIFESLIKIDSSVLNGVNYNNRDYARKIINYPAMMVPSVQESIIETIIKDLPNHVEMIDPFMGASNALVTGMSYGASVFGQDINPLSVLISQVKTFVYSSELNEDYEIIIRKIDNDTSFEVDVNFKNINKWFKDEVQIELSKIRRAILSIENKFHRKFFWVALAETIRLTSNDRTSTFKMHVREAKEIENRKLSPIKYFNKICDRSIQDIFNLKSNLELKGLLENGLYKQEVDVNWGDSKIELKTDKRFNLLVSSPPYGDNHTTVTYGQFSYLPLQWIPTEDIDENISIDYLNVIQEIDSNSLGGRLPEELFNVEKKMFDKSRTLKAFFKGFNTEERKRARKVTSFINDLDVTIDNSLSKMNEDSYLVWTVGNRSVNKKEVENDRILIELFESKGIELFIDLERDILSKRMPVRNNFSNTMNKEKILIFKI